MDHKKFIDQVSREAGLDKETCNAFLDSMVELMEASLSSGDSVSVPSFGNFEPRKRNERVMSHPSAPGKRMLVPPKLVVSFKPSAVLKNKINERAEDEQ